jgi:DNA-binding transcriptional LysR family regulator
VTLRQLQIFIVAAKRLNLRLAAEELHIAQSSISQHLRLLQDEFGKELHRKVGSGIELTPTGKAFLKESKSINARIENLKLKLLSNFAEPVESTLTIGGSYTASSTCLPELLALFKKNHDHVRLRLRTDNGWAIAGKLLTGDIDVALVHNHPGYHQLATEVFANEPVIACVSHDHPLAQKQLLTLDNIRRFGFIIRRPPNSKIGRSYRFIETLDRKGLRPKVVMECDTSEAKKSAVKNQMGIGMMFRSTVQDELKSRELIEVRLPGVKLHRRSYILYHKTRPLSPAARDFIELLRAHRPKP